MQKEISIALISLIIGFGFGFVLPGNLKQDSIQVLSPIVQNIGKKEKIHKLGFLPYWLVDRVQTDDLAKLDAIAYFGLVLEPDGFVRKYDNPGEQEPGWLALHSGKIQTILQKAKSHNIALSLVINKSSEEQIAQLVSDPSGHAANTIHDIALIMKDFGFGDLNIDIETFQEASNTARLNYTQYVREVAKGIREQNLGTVTVSVSPKAFFNPYMIDAAMMGTIADYLVLMTYDFHYAGSYVSGPVAPLGGGGSEYELDVPLSLKLASRLIPPEKTIMGIPLYGYEWETIGNSPGEPVIPGGAMVASMRRVEDLLKDCKNCITGFDAEGKQPYVIFPDESGTYFHQIFYENKASIEHKLPFVSQYGLHGVAFWALGYEAKDAL